MGIEVIARGWDRPEWTGAFYPEDLPEEWRLSYFANVFHGVLVPLDLWQPTDPETLAGWAADVPEGFRFYLELAPGQAQGLSAECLGPKLCGWVAQAPDRAADLPAWGPRGGAIIARQAPVDLIATPRAALAWLATLASDAGGRAALAVLADGPAEGVHRWQELVLLAGLA